MMRMVFLLGWTLALGTPSFETFETEHFVIKFAPGKDRVLIPYAADALEKAYGRLIHDLGVTPSSKTLLEFYPSWQEFMAVSTLTEEQIRTTGTIALCKFNRLMVTTPRALLYGYRWLDTVTHEFTHHLINLASQGKAPVWLHEGIAKYEEVRWRKPTGGEISSLSKSLLRARLEKNRLIPFEKLHPSIAKLPTAEDAEVAFAQVFYFVKYLVEVKGGPNQLRDVLKMIAAGKPVEQAIAAAYATPFLTLYQNWIDWLKTQTLPIAPKTKAKTIVLKENSSVDAPKDLVININDEKARGWIRIGDLLFEEKRHPAALLEYEKALKKLKEPSAPLLNKISVTALESGDAERALRYLTRAIDISSDYPASYVRRGMLFLAQKKWNEAEIDFLEANAINPFDPRVHEGLKAIYQHRNEKELVARETDVLAALVSP